MINNSQCQPVFYSKCRSEIRLSFLIACCLVTSLNLVSAFEKDMNKVYKIGVSEWTGYPDSIRGFKKSMESGGLTERRL
jgi:hypothetical protein